MEQTKKLQSFFDQRETLDSIEFLIDESITQIIFKIITSPSKSVGILDQNHVEMRNISGANFSAAVVENSSVTSESIKTFLHLKMMEAVE